MYVLSIFFASFPASSKTVSLIHVIISASRRTDIPAFYSAWFMNRIREGSCLVVNPYNPARTSRIALNPEAVDAVVFWTRDPLPLLPHLDELERRGYPSVFLFTLLDYPPLLEPRAPSLRHRIDGFQRLSDNIGPPRVIWRYDPIVLSNLTGPSYHADRYAKIARALEGYSTRCIVSILDVYRKVRRGLEPAFRTGFRLLDQESMSRAIEELTPDLAQAAKSHGFTVQSCAEKRDLATHGVPPGACIDAAYLQELFGISVSSRKDPSQRKLCRCAVSRDIGAYDTCPYGCLYCYAVSSPARAAANRRRMRSDSPSLLPPPA